MIFVVSMLTVGMIISDRFLSSSNIKIKNKKLLSFLEDNTFPNDNKNILKQVINEAIKNNNPVKTLYQKYEKYAPKTEMVKEEKTAQEPLIYIYNTHQTEEYYPSNYIEFSINPTVVMNDYILEEVFEKKSFETVVEEASIQEILKNNNWNYSNSYKASRLLMDEAKKKYPSLKYYIDVHRDSLKRDKTTIEIGDKSYAKVLFIVGLENKDYQQNLAFTEQINQKIEKKYPNLSKGIYKKEGIGVNGVYNQDFSPNTILIEIGGYENTTSEVLNSTLAFAECFMEVINESNS